MEHVPSCLWSALLCAQLLAWQFRLSLSAFWTCQTTLFLIPFSWVQSSPVLHGSPVGSQGSPQDLGPVDIEGVQRIELLPLRLTHCRAIPVSFLSGTFSPSCLRGTNCLGEAFSVEGCDLSGTFPRELNEQAWAVSVCLPAPSPCLQLHLEA